jgi:hypothetical protein
LTKFIYGCCALKGRFKSSLKLFSISISLLLVFPFYTRAATIRLPKTGQTNCFSVAGVIIPCTNTGQDGDKQAGVSWPSPRFMDNNNGTVTDNLTGLIWLKNANCTDTAGGIDRSSGLLNWPFALRWSNNLSNGTCGLTDKSAAGDWRLPNINELRSLVDYSRNDPDLPSGHPFINVQSVWYWSSTSNPVYTSGAFTVGMSRGSVHVMTKAKSTIGVSRVGNKNEGDLGVWPVRGGQ